MEEIRGVAAVRYAEREGILFNVDEGYLLRAEGELHSKVATIHDIQEGKPENVRYGFPYRTPNRDRNWIFK